MIDLIDRLATTEGRLDAALLVPVLRLLADGEPVEVGALADAIGQSTEEVEARLALTPDTEYDEQGQIIGLGLSLRPTNHRLTLDGEELYTWCALDTLLFPVVLGRTAVVESVSPVSGQPIRVVVTPTGVSRIEPTTAVVSMVNPEQMTSVRSAFCHEVHYFTSLEDAAPWLEAHPGAELLPVLDAYQFAVTLTKRLLAATGDVTASDTCDRCR